MSNLSNQQEKNPLFVSFYTQKGGAGKSVFTSLAASYLHYEMGYNAAVIDCDYPQWSIHNLRERETKQLKENAFYLKKAKALFEKIKKKAYPILSSKPETALADAEKFLTNDERKFDIVFFDLPGTVNNRDVVNILLNMDYLFVPITTSRINMESTLAFVHRIDEVLKKGIPTIRLKNAHTFWNRIMSKERQELLTAYENAIDEIGVSRMKTRIPNSVRYDREQSVSGSENLFLSTLLPPDKPLLKGSSWDVLMNEFLDLTNLKKTE